MPPILYLDYEGVLHPADVRLTNAEPMRPRVYQQGRTTDHPLFEHASLLANVLEPFPEVRVSLGTSWARTPGLSISYGEQAIPQDLCRRLH